MAAFVANASAFTSVVVRNGATYGGRGVCRNRPGIPKLVAKASVRSSVLLTAHCGALRMSEMAEDYPSDTGDDRFSPGGEHLLMRIHTPGDPWA